MKVLILASGKTATQIKEIDTSNFTVIAVNNAWKATDKWNYWIHAMDYKGNRPESVRGNQTVVKSAEKVLSNYGGVYHCGYSITLCASYWALHTLKPSEIYYLGCDMNYEPDKHGSTHFYGVGYDIGRRGVSDPDAMAKRWKDPEQTEDEYIQQIYLRFKQTAEEKGCTVWNASRIDETKTRLPYPPKLLF